MTRQWRHRIISLFVGLLAVLLVGLPGWAGSPPVVAEHPQTLAQLSPEQQGRSHYEVGQYQAAIAQFQQALRQAEAQGDGLTQGMLWGNLALANYKLGQWEAANRAIAISLNLLNQSSVRSLPGRDAVLASALEIAGTVQLAQGQAEMALDSWEQAAALYAQQGDRPRQIQALVSQARALRVLGFYRRAVSLLSPLAAELEGEESPLAVATLNSLGDAFYASGNLRQAQQVLLRSRAIAQRLNLAEALAVAHLRLGNVARAQGDRPTALRYYQDAMESPDPLIRLQAGLNALRLQVAAADFVAAQALWDEAIALLEPLPASRLAVEARTSLAISLLEWRAQGDEVTAPSVAEIEDILNVAIRQAAELGDRRAESSAVGTLGQLYEQQQRWADADATTQRALQLANRANAPDLAYRWHWQLGRILQAQWQETQDPALLARATAAFGNAVEVLQTIRTDLIALNPEVQFSFQDSIEPIYRDYMDLLMQSPENVAVPVSNLERARQTIETLQQAELENFFREACLDTQPVAPEQLDAKAAIFYPIVLSDRLELIVSLPGSDLRYYTIPVSGAELAQQAQLFREVVTNRSRPLSFSLPAAQQMYNWLVRPALADLAQTPIETLVFFLDGDLRNIPVAALHDGNRYLLERYRLALTPGLQLLPAQAGSAPRQRVLAAGLTEPRQGFSALPNVQTELTDIESQLPTQVLVNQAFTPRAFQAALLNTSTAIVHLATHGQFSSNVDDTYVLTWNERLTINGLRDLLQRTTLMRGEPIDLLVLSACKTASGDRRATLGLAGMAVRSGARSTIASLWSIDDEATAELMAQLYKELANDSVSKSEALRRAQLTILNNPKNWQHPYFWAGLVLVGDWL